MKSSLLLHNLADSSVLHIRERYKNGEHIKYSYHLMKGNKVIRWDNVPHHKEISTYPHHKHENDKIEKSTKIDISMVLVEIERNLKIDENHEISRDRHKKTK